MGTNSLQLCRTATTNRRHSMTGGDERSSRRQAVMGGVPVQMPGMFSKVMVNAKEDIFNLIDSSGWMDLPERVTSPTCLVRNTMYLSYSLDYIKFHNLLEEHAYCFGRSI